MQTIHAAHALLPDGWKDDVRVTVSNGVITSAEAGAIRTSEAIRVDALLPAPCNVHSHCFQRAMAGMTEHRARGRDDFWSWRELMYRFLDHLTPEDYEAIAALVFMEMAEAGYASVGEFHYVHHQPGGPAYGAVDEMSRRVFAAALETGIGLTHLPVLYAFGGTGEAPLHGGQLRFGNDMNGFERLLDSVLDSARELPHDTVIGVAPHSLRAVNPAQMRALADRHTGGPIHIHAAEQPKEVADTQAWLGARPVEWLLREMPLGPNWCLIHCTHMTDDETQRLARSGAVAGLCPVTEANLGDGIFNGQAYLAEKGAFGTGSDSNIRITLSGELAQLEYSQRLKSGTRNALAMDEGSTGEQLYLRAARGSAQALGRASGAIATGMLADLTALNTRSLALCALKPAQFLDGWIFAGDDRAVSDVWSAGRHIVRGGRHHAHDAITARYRATMADLVARL
jgi:formimidoylglutamate deiminase